MFICKLIRITSMKNDMSFPNLTNSMKMVLAFMLCVFMSMSSVVAQDAYAVSVYSFNNVNSRHSALGASDSSDAVLNNNSEIILKLDGTVEPGTDIEFRIRTDNNGNGNGFGTIDASASVSGFPTSLKKSISDIKKNYKIYTISVVQSGIQYVKVAASDYFHLDSVSFTRAMVAPPTTNPCTDGAIVGTPTSNDTDGDGINDICDLDDDNDGILDTIEGCGPSGGNGSLNISSHFPSSNSSSTNITSSFNGSYVTSISGINANYTFYTELSNSDNRIRRYYYNPNNGGQGNLFKFTVGENRSASIDINFEDTNGNPTLISGGKFKITDFDEKEQVTVDAYDQNGNLILLKSASHNYTSDYITNIGTQVVHNNGNVFTTISNPDTSVDGDNVSGDAKGSVIFDFSGQLISRIKISTYHVRNGNSSIRFTEVNGFCKPLDTDGDGTPNSQDVDSDGDGCFDAMEGSDGTITSSDVNPDGTLNGNIDSNGVPVKVNGGQTTTPALFDANDNSPCVDPCTDPNGVDTDGDGINDICDLDSDNDGILDSVEQTLNCTTAKQPQFTGQPTPIGTSSLSNPQEEDSFRYSNVYSGVDAIVTVVALNGDDIVDFDVTSSGYDQNFQPRINHATATSFTEFKIDFVNSGTTTAAPLDNYMLTTIDNDVDEFVTYMDGYSTGVIVDTPTNNVPYTGQPANADGFSQGYVSDGTFVSGVSTDTPGYQVAAMYSGIS